MALEFLSKVITTYSANVSDHVAALEKLTGKQREQAESAIAAGKKVEASLEGQVTKLNKVQEALGLVKQAASFAMEAFLASVEHNRLSIASMGANIDGLRKAAGGLKSEMDLLRDAARLQAGEFKLNQHQMEMVEQAMLVLQRRGFESQKVNEAVTKSLVSLQTDGLKELGIRVNASGLDMEKASDRAVLYDRVLAKLAETSRQAGDGQQTAQEKILAAGNTINDSFDRLKRALGEVVTAFEPLFTSLSKIADKISKIVELAARLPGGASKTRATSMGALEAGSILDEEFNNAVGGTPQDELPGLGSISGSDSGPRQVTQPAFRFNDAEDKDRWAAKLEKVKERDKQLEQQAKAHAERLKAIYKEVWGDPEEAAFEAYRKQQQAKRLSSLYSRGGAPSGTFGGGIDPGLFGSSLFGPNDSLFGSVEDNRLRANTEMLDEFGRPVALDLAAPLNARLTKSWNDRIGANQKQKSKLASMFGPLEEFNAYKKAFDMLSGAVTSAMTAWIDGSMSAGKAFKLFIAESLKGLAVQMAVESLKNFAYAAASAVPGPTFNPAAVGGYLKTGALFAGVAAAAAVGAKTLGGGGGVPSTGAGAAAPVGSASAAPQYQGRTETIIVGDSGGTDSPRKRARNFRRRSDEAYGSANGSAAR